VCKQVEALDTKVTQAQQASEQTANLRVLRGDAISEALAAARHDTDIWMFKGGTGTFIRAVTLPECIQHARENGRTLIVRLEILDPTDDDLCEHYATFQRETSQPMGGTEDVWTVARTKEESFATILAACWHRQRYRPLTMEISLSSTISTFRWELSSHYLIMTQLIAQRNAQEPAMLIKRGSAYYDRYVTELRTSFEQSRILPIEQAARAVPLSDEPSTEETQRIFLALNLPLSSSYDDGSVSTIIRKAIRAKNSYS
jgi:hypothetical protein